jgi:hypothetical protein
MGLTEKELREIEQRAERATKGPDAEFIAHAREDVLRLIEEIRRLKSELQRIWEIIEGSSYYGEFERAYEQLKELEGGE